MNYIDRINILKQQKRMTNDQLAKKSGVPIGTLSKLMAGITDSPKLSNIISICGVLDCSLDYLIYGKEQTDGFSLERDEIAMVKKYRELDSHGKDIVYTILSKEHDRIITANATKERGATVLPTFQPDITPSKKTFNIPLYDLPVSAGIGSVLDNTYAEKVAILYSEQTKGASFAVRISGNSMEPKYKSGDILLVKQQASVNEGELGIFVLDGEGYFKKFGGDRLISLNPDYKDIMLSEYEDITCKGKILGKVK